MGQQQTTMTAATEEKGGGTLRRMILVLAAAALMAAMMALSAVPAMAKNIKGPEGGEPTQNFGDAANSAAVFHDLGDKIVVFNHGRS